MSQVAGSVMSKYVLDIINTVFCCKPMLSIKQHDCTNPISQESTVSACQRFTASFAASSSDWDTTVARRTPWLLSIHSPASRVGFRGCRVRVTELVSVGDKLTAAVKVSFLLSTEHSDVHIAKLLTRGSPRGPEIAIDSHLYIDKWYDLTMSP